MTPSAAGLGLAAIARTGVRRSAATAALVAVTSALQTSVARVGPTLKSWVSHLATVVDAGDRGSADPAVRDLSADLCGRA